MLESLDDDNNNKLTVPITESLSENSSLRTIMRRLVLVNQHVIQITMAHVFDRVNHPGLGQSKKNIPYYYRIMAEYAKQSAASKGFIAGLICHACAEVIPEGDFALSMARGSHGRKYYHEQCGIRLGLI